MQIKTNGQPLTDRDVRRGLRINIVAGSLGTIWGVIVGGMPLTMFMKCIGASGVMIGLTSTVGQLAMLLQVPAALMAERLPARKSFWGFLCVIHRLLWFVPAVLPLFMAPGRGLGVAVVAAVAVSGILAQVATASWWSWMAELVPSEQRGGFWGKRQTVCASVGLVAMLATGYLLDAFPDPSHPGGSFFGYVLVFGFAAIFGAADILVHLWVPEPRPAPLARASGIWRRLRVPFENRDFMRLTLAMGVWTFGVGLVGQFGFIFLNRAFDVNYSEMSLLGVCATAGVILGGIMWGYVMDRVGARNFGAIMMLVAPLFGVAWFFLRHTNVTLPVPLLDLPQVSQPLVVLGVVNIFAGMFYSGVGLAQISLLSALAPAEGRTLAMAAHWSVVGLIGAAGPLVGGAVMDGVDAFMKLRPAWIMPTGTTFGFFHVLILLQIAVTWFIGVRLLLAVTQRQGEMAFRTALSSLQFTNPLRMFSGVYNIVSMLSSDSVETRADAARKIGEDRVRIAVRDLVERLDDASYDVRQEAATALGRIGSPDAIEALIRKLEDPDGDLGPVIARALRYARDQASVEALIRRLGDKDRETVSESARTLGDLGDARAASPLMEVLRKSEDAKVISASGMALAQLGEMAAIYDILPIMQSTRNPVLKRSLAVAVGDLLGQPGRFYRLLSREQRDRGTTVEEMMSELRKALTTATSEAMNPQGRKLAERLDLVTEAYAQREFQRLAQLLFECAIGLAAVRYGLEFGGDEEVFLETLVWRDARFGIGVWYLELLRETSLRGDGAIDDTGALLGIYVLSLWGSEKKE